MKTLYPETDIFDSGFIRTESEHSVYFEQAGNTEGIPAIFLHGGPGSGCNENHRRYFNPEKYRIILLDQRGCHRSTPNGWVEKNTTDNILNDIESIRKRLKIDKWCLFGGSWGATLALLYAERFPKHVSGMVLRGTFLARQFDFQWFTRSGVTKIFPDYWEEFLSFFNEEERKHPIVALYNRLFSHQTDVQFEAAKTWALWAGRVVTHSLVDTYELEIEDKDKLINEVRIEMHYAKNRYFIKENQILDEIKQVPDVPIFIIHGRRDLTCLPESSWLIYKALPKSKLIMIKDAGHLASETVMIDALIKATDKMADLLV